MARRRTRRRLAALAGAVVGLAALGGGRPVQAQNNTYKDFPFNQGSAFYQYRPYRSNSGTTTTTAPRTTTRRGWFARRSAQAPAYTAAPRAYYTTPPQAPAPPVYYAQPALPQPPAVPTGRR